MDRELVRDEGFLVGPEEYDSPPPSTRPLGGEGEISEGFVRSDPTSYDTPTQNNYTIYLISGSSGIDFIRKTYTGGEVTNWGLVYVEGSDSLTTITKNPQISQANQGDIVTLQCVSNKIVISNTNGVTLMNSHFVMDSGSLLTLVYQTGNSVWQESSRGHCYKSIGGL